MTDQEDMEHMKVYLEQVKADGKAARDRVVGGAPYLSTSKVEPVKRKHDPQVCGLSADTDCDNCRAKTMEYRRRELRLGDLQALEERLKKGGIDVGTFSDLVWMHIHAAIDRKVEELVKEHVERILNDCSVVSVIRGIRYDSKPASQAEGWD